MLHRLIGKYEAHHSVCRNFASHRFTNGHNVAPDTHWLSSLDRVDGPTPPPSTAFRHQPSSEYPTPPPLPYPPASSPSISPRPPHAIAPLIHPDVGGQTDLRTLIQEQARAIASLEAEKVSLNASAEQLKHAETSKFSASISPCG